MAKWEHVVLLAAFILLPRSSPGQIDGNYNVKSYGARGDGVSDDTAAINTALGSASASKGTVFFPPGIYSIGAPILPSADVTIAGAGRGASFLKAGAGFQTRGNG